MFGKFFSLKIAAVMLIFTVNIFCIFQDIQRSVWCHFVFQFLWIVTLFFIQANRLFDSNYCYYY